MINADPVCLIFKTWQAHKTRLAVVHSIAKAISACLFKIETVNTVRANQALTVQCRWCLRLMQMSQSGCAELAGHYAHFWLHLLSFDIPNIKHFYSSNCKIYTRSILRAVALLQFEQLRMSDNRHLRTEMGNTWPCICKAKLVRSWAPLPVTAPFMRNHVGESERHMQVSFSYLLILLVCQYVI